MGLGLAAAVWLVQAEFVPAVGLRGRTLETKAGKSSSWKEEFFLGWDEYAGVMGVETAATVRLGKSSSFSGPRAAAPIAGAGFTLDAAAVAPNAGKSSSSPGFVLFMVLTGGLLDIGPVLCLGSSGSALSVRSSRQCLGALLSCTAPLSSCLRMAIDALIAAATSLSSSSREYLQLFCPP